MDGSAFAHHQQCPLNSIDLKCSASSILLAQVTRGRINSDGLSPEDKEDRHFELSIDTTGRISHQLKQVNSTAGFDQASLDLYNLLKKLDLHSKEVQPCKIGFKVSVVGKFRDHMTFTESMQTLTIDGFDRKAYAPYCYNSGEPALQLGQFIARTKVEDALDGRIIQIPSLVSFDHTRQ